MKPSSSSSSSSSSSPSSSPSPSPSSLKILRKQREISSSSYSTNTKTSTTISSPSSSPIPSPPFRVPPPNVWISSWDEYTSLLPHNGTFSQSHHNEQFYVPIGLPMPWPIPPAGKCHFTVQNPTSHGEEFDDDISSGGCCVSGDVCPCVASGVECLNYCICHKGKQRISECQKAKKTFFDHWISDKSKWGKERRNAMEKRNAKVMEILTKKQSLLDSQNKEKEEKCKKIFLSSITSQFPHLSHSVLSSLSSPLLLLFAYHGDLETQLSCYRYNRTCQLPSRATHYEYLLSPNGKYVIRSEWIDIEDYSYGHDNDPTGPTSGKRFLYSLQEMEMEMERKEKGKKKDTEEVKRSVSHINISLTDSERITRGRSYGVPLGFPSSWSNITNHLGKTTGEGIVEIKWVTSPVLRNKGKEREKEKMESKGKVQISPPTSSSLSILEMKIQKKDQIDGRSGDLITCYMEIDSNVGREVDEKEVMKMILSAGVTTVNEIALLICEYSRTLAKDIRDAKDGDTISSMISQYEM